MSKVKAVVAGFEGKTMIVLTKDGQFRELPLPKSPPALGEEIEIKERPAAKLFRPFLAAAAVLILAVALGLFNLLASPVAAYVTVDINPGVEIWVSGKAEVTKVKPLNEDGEKIISDVSTKDKDLYETLNTLINNCLKMGYLDKTQENLVLVSVTPTRNQIEEPVDEARLRAAISDQLSAHQVPGYIVLNKADEAQREQARKAGLSVNRLLIYQQAQKGGINIPENALRGRDLLQVLREAQLSVKDLFPQNTSEIIFEQSLELSKPATVYENVEQPGEQFQKTEVRQDTRNNNAGNAKPNNSSSWFDSTGPTSSTATGTDPVTITEDPAGQEQPEENNQVDNQKENTRGVPYADNVKQAPGEGQAANPAGSGDKYEMNTGQPVPAEGNEKTPEAKPDSPTNQNQDSNKLSKTGGDSGSNTGGTGGGGGSSGSRGSSGSNGNSGSSGNSGGGSWSSW